MNEADQDFDDDDLWDGEELEAEITGINSIENYREIYNAIKNELYSSKCRSEISFSWLTILADGCFANADEHLAEFRDSSSGPNVDLYNSDSFKNFFKDKIQPTLRESCRQFADRVNSQVTEYFLDLLNMFSDRYDFFSEIEEHQGIDIDFEPVTPEWLCIVFNQLWDEFYANFDSTLRQKHYPKEIEDLMREYIKPKLINFQARYYD